MNVIVKLKLEGLGVNSRHCQSGTLCYQGIFLKVCQGRPSEQTHSLKGQQSPFLGLLKSLRLR